MTGTQAANAINECRLMEIPVFGIVNTAVNHPHVLYPIPCNDASGASFNMIMGALQGMALRVDMLQKKRLLLMILLEAQLKNRVKLDEWRRAVDVEEEGDTNEMMGRPQRKPTL